jgi:[protein-PII] uridylyltransferase
MSQVIMILKRLINGERDVEKQLQESYENGQSIREIIKARSNIVMKH